MADTQHIEPEEEVVANKAELLRQFKESAHPEDDEVMRQIVVIALNDDYYGIPILAAREILKIWKITWLPCTPAYVAGAISVRGDIQSVIDLKQFLELGSTELTDNSRIILAESGELVTGLLVDEMVDITEIPESGVLPLQPAALNITQNFVTGKARWKEKMVTLLEIDTIIQSVVVEQN